MAKTRDANIDNMLKGVLTLETVDECYDFFKDLCTINELKAMAQRYKVAQMLTEGKVYTDIVDQTGASTATISRVNRSLTDGNDGYALVFSRLEDENK